MYQVDVPAVRAGDLKEAFRLLEEGGCILNGGTGILVRLKEGAAAPSRLVDISSIPQLRSIEVTPKKVVIGGAVTVNGLRSHPVVREEFPALAMAADSFGWVQIRNRATLVGGVAAASSAGDAVTALYAYDAVVQLRRKSGRREMPVAGFIAGSGKTELGPDEVIVGIALPRVRGGDHLGAFNKVGGRRVGSISKASVAVAAVAAPSGVLRRVAIALGAVSPVVIRLPEAEALLSGRKMDPELARKARAIASAAIEPLNDGRFTDTYLRHVSGVIVERALRSLGRAVS